MKQTISFLLVFLLCGALAACGTAKPSVEDSVNSMDVSSMYNQETGKTVSLGMTKKAVEKILGKGKMQEQLPLSMEPLYEEDTAFSDSDVTYVSYGTGEDLLTVSYRENQAMVLSNAGNFQGVKPGPSHWCVKYGLSYGSSLEDILEKYGQTESYPLAPSPEQAKEGQGALDTPNVSWKEPVLVTYFFDQRGKPLENGGDEKARYQLLFFVDEAQDGLMWYAMQLHN